MAKSSEKTTTIINNPSGDSGSGMGMVFGVIILVVVGYLIWVYGIPAIQQMQSEGVQINVPSSIDVNVNQTK
ncbi:TPA: hypothetical protein DIU27_03670 [Candidatus Collierbacteria bacterium]|uniref:Uncharacterized protein n=1 Tax=Candidatus Collierbacteria bacterium GW2011_GWB2_44_22 TaxID=1618387 RepID=A0A0G1KWJ9_9BACT|nr:MAG: hypothetical protein UW31_C0007G0058 [Candidatus Collierbacteria bacterium GW2011_GWA2_44_13]KKT49422.1 MAG: hypothetical protein UW42_C0035G0006 [Candidatus Collierbacteria bacterium GW2011_GWB1_44_197]KKT52289.1 MAG: hypothetical protein UW44_C0003G0132 [Candidatus Collierbacteria bacterium GW2011_GWB2_44_22]KKT63209.1 MAG: hypothetical protein UW56_C0001G0046 [Candidatus Collierbacteria bacterium GW2011_GWD1_44_27]KKT66119.1 MAG: hypothetical protein UW58_C0013G0047 [Candidatus Colli